MSEKYKTFEGKLYYVTLTVVGWIDVFTRKDHAYEIIRNIKYCQEHKGLKLYAYVIMSNHLHFVCSTENGTLNEVLRDFKSYTAKQLIQLIEDHSQESRKEWLLYLFRYFGRKNPANQEFQFWQNGTHAIELYSPEVIRQKINYIHLNPVKAGFVAEPHHWLYSSANQFSDIKVLDL